MGELIPETSSLVQTFLVFLAAADAEGSDVAGSVVGAVLAAGAVDCGAVELGAAGVAAGRDWAEEVESVHQSAAAAQKMASCEGNTNGCFKVGLQSLYSADFQLVREV
jgi:hypothetical protein